MSSTSTPEPSTPDPKKTGPGMAGQAARAAGKVAVRAAGKAALANPWVLGVVAAVTAIVVLIVALPLLLAGPSNTIQIESNQFDSSNTKAVLSSNVAAAQVTAAQGAAGDKGVNWLVLSGIFLGQKDAGTTSASNALGLNPDAVKKVPNTKGPSGQSGAADLQVSMAWLSEQIRQDAHKIPGFDPDLDIGNGGTIDSKGQISWVNAKEHQDRVVAPWTKLIGMLPLAPGGNPATMINDAVTWRLSGTVNDCAVPSSDTSTSPAATSIDLSGLPGLVANADKVVVAVRTKFPAITTVYGVRHDADAQDHATGHAVDLMLPTPYSSPTNHALGQQIADWVKTNAKVLGVQYIMWDHSIWNIARDAEGWRNVPDRGSDTANHMDHVHVSVNDTNTGSQMPDGIAAYQAKGTPSSGPSSTTTPAPSQPAAPVASSPASSPATTTGQITVPAGLTYDTGMGSLKVTAPMLRNEAIMISVVNANKAKFGGDAGAQKAMLVATITMAIEDGFMNNASMRVPESLKYPHDGVDAGDSSSIGLYQQLSDHGGWGSVEQIMNQVYSTSMFLGLKPAGEPADHAPGLLDQKDWQGTEPGVLAQKIQLSDFPDRYEKALGSAPAMIKAASGISVDAGSLGADTTCGANGSTGVGGPAVVGSAGNINDTYLPYWEQHGGAPGADMGPDPWEFYWGECVSYVAWMVRTTTSAKDFNNNTWVGPNGHTSHWGNANQWADAARATGVPIDTTPSVGAVAERMSGASGHVAIVIAVNPDGTINVAEYNHEGHHIFGIRKNVNWREDTNQGFTYFIHFPGSTLAQQASGGSAPAASASAPAAAAKQP